MLTTNDLRYAYPQGPTLSFPDLRCAAGEPLLLLGPSGSGKSTLLHLLGGILALPQYCGRAMVLNGEPYHELSGRRLDAFRGRNIGIVFQRPYFVASLNVAENLAVARKMAGLSADPRRIQSLLDSLGIGHYAGQSPHDLSVGEQQRVTIARALVNEPKLLLADEPTSALDRGNAERVSALLRERAEELGAALVVVTHDDRLRGDFSNLITLNSHHTPA